MSTDDYAQRQRAVRRQTVSWISELSWGTDGGAYVAYGYQAAYRLDKDHFGNWQLWVTRDGKTVNAGWREHSLHAAKEAALDEEKDFARKAIQ